MTPFASFADAGQALAPVAIAALTSAHPCVIGLNARGALVAAPVAAALGVQPVRANVVRVDGEREVHGLPEVAGHEVLVVDDGVESGTAARLVAARLRDLGAARIVLAVPVCSAVQVASMCETYNALVHLVSSAPGQSLSGHYESFDDLS